MQFALLIYESPESFEQRKSDGTDPYTGAWRAYYKSMVEARGLCRWRSLGSPGNGHHHQNQERQT